MGEGTSRRMKVAAPFLGLTAGVLLLAGNALAEGEADRFWPQWRGPLGTGVAPHGDPPVHWSETNGVRWKTPLPGVGHSTPVLWDNRIYVTAAAPTGKGQEPVYNMASGAHDNFAITNRFDYMVLALDRADGKVLWNRKVHQALPHEGGHYTGSQASASPVTDGSHVFAYFGSHGLYCLDTEGTVVWELQLGRMNTKHAHGEGSSPALHGDILVVNWDHEGDSFVAGLDKRTGRTLWKKDRNEPTSWSSPMVVEHDGRAQVVVSATERVRGYDLKTGEVIWECAGLSHNVVATPVAGHGLVFVANSYDRQAMLAIRLEGARGDITDTDQVVWSRNRLTPYVPSPLLYDDTLYFIRHLQGILSCVDARTGVDRHGPFRLNGIGMVFASPAGAAGRIYIADRQGATLVFRHGPDPEPLAMNHLEDAFSASPVIAGKELYLRGERSLYCLVEE